MQKALSEVFEGFFLQIHLLGMNIGDQGLIQKEKVCIHCEKGAQLNILASKIATQWWPNIIIKQSKQTIRYIYFLFSRYYVRIMLVIWPKNWNCVYWKSQFYLRFNLSTSKIGIPISKTAYINPWWYLVHNK